MNLFQKYGIKEVADVTFYSINRVGDEEIYTPILFLDTLKVSTLEKKSVTNDSFGGYGNQKISSWSCNKQITLKLEDALFTPTSMSLVWGGYLKAKFSKYTSAIVKINIANKYGKLHYAPNIYPSPELTNEEWEVIYQACDDLGKSFLYKIIDGQEQRIPFMSDNISETPYVEENRALLKRSYLQRDFLDIYSEVAPAGDKYKWEHLVKQENIAIPDSVVKQILLQIKTLKDFEDFSNSIYTVDVIDRMEKCIVTDKDGLEISTEEQKQNLLKYYLNDKSSSYSIYYDIKTMLPLLNTDEKGKIIDWDNVVETDTSDSIEPNINDSKFQDYLRTLATEELITSLADVQETINNVKIKTKWQLMQLLVIQLKEINPQVEILWGYDKNGYFRAIKSNNDKDMFDFTYNVKIIHSTEDEQEDITNEFEPGQVFMPRKKLFVLKPGTAYLKWTRQVKPKNGSSDGVLGNTLVISADTFPSTFKIVGETYIREQQTGRDQRYQFVIHEAQVTSDTNITLQAEGDPTVFNMNINVFTPPNDIMMELRQYDVIEDNVYGGTRIVPQKSLMTTTQIITEEEVIPELENEQFI